MFRLRLQLPVLFLQQEFRHGFRLVRQQIPHTIRLRAAEKLRRGRDTNSNEMRIFNHQKL